jgi:hypothetical protein
MSIVEKAFLEIISNGAIKRENLIGCSDREIDIIEKHFSFTLPYEYRKFLSVAGKGAGKLFQGSDIFFPSLLELQEEAKYLLLELSLDNLFDGSEKIFYMHQGYEFNYFKDLSADPVVMQFTEGCDGPIVAYERFSDFIISSIKEHLSGWPRLD